MLLLLIASILISLLIFDFIKKHQWKKLGFPIVRGLPIIGSLHKLIDPLNSLNFIDNSILTYGPNYILQVAFHKVLVVSEPKLLEVIMGSSKALRKSEEYKFLIRWFGDGLLTSTGLKWKNHRKILTPSFHYKILEEFVDIFSSASDILIDKLKKVENNSLDIYYYISLCTLDIICETAMGTKANIQQNPKCDFVTQTKVMCNITFVRCFSMFIRFDYFYYLSRFYQKERKAIKILRKFSNDIIQERKKCLHSQKQNTGKVSDEFGIKRRSNFLDVLLESNLSDKNVQEEVDTFIFEGHDTTAGGISFAIYLLSRNREAQDQAYEEIKMIFGDDKNRAATYDDLGQMKYLEMVIKETLRIFPSVPVFGRRLDQDIEYEGKILPKGLEIALFVYETHKNPEIYPDPEKFIPERFSLGNSQNRHPYAYLPFSAGQRNCIGQKFAMLELKSTISKILRNFEILPGDEEIVLMSQVTLISANGIRVKLKERY